MNPSQWEAVERQAKDREEHKGFCPICKEMLGKTLSVILSCSHVFHKNCLLSFERHTGKKACPICRKQAYDTKHFAETEVYYREFCLIKLQSWFRGFLARKEYLRLRVLHPPTHPLVRRKFFQKQLTGLSNVMQVEMNRHQDEIEELFRDIDQHVEASREAVKQFKLHHKSGLDEREIEYREMQENDSKQLDEWRRVKQLAYLRQDKECPICLHEFSTRRELCILSCSHVFHMRCIAAFESFDVRLRSVCPVCRTEYTRTKFFYKLEA